MEKNRTWQSFWLTLIVLVVLIALFWLPRISLGGTELRRVNLLSDVRGVSVNLDSACADKLLCFSARADACFGQNLLQSFFFYLFKILKWVDIYAIDF